MSILSIQLFLFKCDIFHWNKCNGKTRFGNKSFTVFRVFSVLLPQSSISWVLTDGRHALSA